MRIRSLVLYAALGLGVNTPHVFAADLPAMEAARAGDMRKLTLSANPPDLSSAALEDEAGNPRSIAEWRGKPVLINFWATWCAPCREEMPSLERLQKKMADTPFEVVTVATGRSDARGVDKFLNEIGVTELPRLRDPKMQMARDMGVLGLPVSVLVDADGREVARLIGDADWDTPEAAAIIEALIRPSQ